MTALSVALVAPLILMILLVYDQTTKIYLFFFAWGSFSGLIAVSLNQLGHTVFGLPPESIAIQFAPIAEEFAKAIPLFVLLVVLPGFLERKKVILAAICSGIGFSVVENYAYLIAEPNLSAGALAVFVLTRSLSTTVMHGLATGLIGGGFYYLQTGGLAQFRFRPIFVIMSYAFAVIVHALFNLYVQFSLFGRTVALMASILLYFISWVFFRFYYVKL